MARDFLLHYKNLNKQLFLRMEGEGGTGKSYTIDSWCNLLDLGTYFVAAFTGKAAHLVQGFTIHQMLNIIPNETKELSNVALRSLQDRFKNIKFIIIDEYSMVGCKLFYLIDKRLRQAKNSDLPFGGLTVLLAGDYLQLVPVGDTALWHDDTLSVHQEIFDGIFLFKQFQKQVILKDI